jgi:hypothetical protein
VRKLKGLVSVLEEEKQEAEQTLTQTREELVATISLSHVFLLLTSFFISLLR